MQNEDIGDQDKTPGERRSIQEHEEEKDSEEDSVVRITGQDARDGEDKFRNINLANEVLAVDDRGRGDDYGLLDHEPGDETGKKKDGVVFDLEADDHREDDSQDEKKKEGVKDGPQESEGRSPVADLEFGRGEVKKEIPVANKLPDSFPSSAHRRLYFSPNAGEETNGTGD
jgi:hypothetical protein